MLLILYPLIDIFFVIGNGVYIVNRLEVNWTYLVPFMVANFLIWTHFMVPPMAFVLIFGQLTSLLSNWITKIGAKSDQICCLYRNGIKPVNEVLSRMIFLVMTSYLILSVMAFYWIVHVSSKPNLDLTEKICLSLSLFMSCFNFSMVILYLNYMSQSIVNQIQKLKEEIVEQEDREEMRFKALFYLDNFQGFDANGFFTLGKPLLTSFVGNVLTFIIILVQFRISE